MGVADDEGKKQEASSPQHRIFSTVDQVVLKHIRDITYESAKLRVRSEHQINVIDKIPLRERLSITILLNKASPFEDFRAKVPCLVSDRQQRDLLHTAMQSPALVIFLLTIHITDPIDHREQMATVRITPENLRDAFTQWGNWYPNPGVPEDRQHAQSCIDWLDHALPYIEDDKELYGRGVRRLRRYCRAIESLPQSCISADRIVFNAHIPFSSSALSDVYQGKLHDRLVAIKAIRIHINNYADAMKAFYNEVVAWKLLRHPNIARLLCVSEYFPISMVSEWQSNGTVEAFLGRNPNIDRMPLILGIAEGLKYMHSLEIVHGDLKPQNVLVDAAGHALLTDFGISTFVHSTTTLNSTAVTRGTVRWMAPELLEHNDNGEENKPSKASDVFAMGLVFWALYSGETPFHQIKHDFHFFRQLLEGERPARPSNTPAVALTNSLWSLIKWTWLHDWKWRPELDQVTVALSSLDFIFIPWKDWKSNETIQIFSNLNRIRTYEWIISPSGKCVAWRFHSENGLSLGILSISPQGSRGLCCIRLTRFEYFFNCGFTGDSCYIYAIIVGLMKCGVLHVWESASGRVIGRPLPSPPDALTTCLSNGFGDVSALFFDRKSWTVKLVQVTTGNLVDELDLSEAWPRHYDWPWKLSCSSDGQRAVLSGYDRFVVLGTIPLSVLQVWDASWVSQLCHRSDKALMENFEITWNATSLHLLATCKDPLCLHNNKFVHLFWEDVSSPPHVTFITPSVSLKYTPYFTISPNGKNMAFKHGRALEVIELPAGCLIWNLAVDGDPWNIKFADSEGRFIYIEEGNLFTRKTFTLYATGNSSPILRIDDVGSMTLLDKDAALRYAAHIDRP